MYTNYTGNYTFSLHWDASDNNSSLLINNDFNGFDNNLYLISFITLYASIRFENILFIVLKVTSKQIVGQKKRTFSAFLISYVFVP